MFTHFFNPVVQFLGTIIPFAAEHFVRAIKKMNADMGIPAKLSCIRPEDIETMSRFADREGNPLYPVPRLMDARDLQQFYALVSEENETAAH